MILALSLSILVPIIFSTKHFLIRRFSGTYNGNELPVDSVLLENATLTVFSFIYGFEIGYNDPMRILYGSIGGCFMSIGKIYIAKAVAFGQAGPS